MNIYLTELRHQWKALAFWSLGIVAFMVSAMSKYDGYRKAGTSVNEIFRELPGGISAFFGADILDLQSVGGFFTICALYLAVMLGIHALLMGSGIIAKEETDKTIEFLVAKPVSRDRILLAKLLVGLTTIVILNLVTLAVSIASVAPFDPGPTDNGDIVFLMPSVFAIQLIFLVIGLTFAAVMRQPRHAGMLSGAVLLASFILSAWVDISGRLRFLRFLTPFQYFDQKSIYANHAYSAAHVVIAAAAVAVMLAASRFVYRGRDFSL
ncbi:MAG: ABC transporter [Gaiellales bacterium]|nr:MAG: ABC transporter [Gaiellales bacterium]